MSSDFIWEIFQQSFLGEKAKKISWLPNSNNSIRVELEGGEQIIFHFIDLHNWKIETSKSYLDYLKEVGKSNSAM